MGRDRLGEVGLNNQGLEMAITEYKNSKNITVEFLDGTKVLNREYADFKKGTIKNPNFPSFYGIGYVGGKVENKSAYSAWVDMLKRSYDKTLKEKYQTYEECYVCKEWHNFQNFQKWYIENLWSKECYFLDKDILKKGNKEYSPSTCVLVDNRINLLFTKTNSKRGDFPIGVYYKKNLGKFVAQCSIITDKGKRQQHLGVFPTPHQAFLKYKGFKEDYIKQVAESYKLKHLNFPQELYLAMYQYIVEISD